MKRPRLLYLAYAFPPLNTVGCGRAWNTAMYLSRLEWDVTVVTPDPSLWQKVEDASGVNLRIEQEGLRRIPHGTRLARSQPHLPPPGRAHRALVWGRMS